MIKSTKRNQLQIAAPLAALVSSDPDRYDITVRQQRYMLVAAVKRLDMQTDSLRVLQCT